MQEKEFIKIFKKRVGQKFNLPESELWKQRDFDYLSNLIFKKTNTRLSISTLKRIWKDYDKRNPQIYTLNTLAHLLDYNSWDEFRESSRSELSLPHSPPYKSERPYHRKSMYASLLIIPLLFVITYIILQYNGRSSESYKTEQIVFKSRKTSSVGVPNTVVFEYDISNLDFDSAFIQQSWDERMRARINRDNHFQTFIYYYPGFHTARLIVNNTIVKWEKININTAGWEAIVSTATVSEPPHYIKQDDIINNNSLSVSPEILLSYGISPKDKKFILEYFNVGEFNKVNGEDFTFKTRFKNNQVEGSVCQFSQITIICENGRVSIPFSHPGCVSNIHLHIGEVVKSGKKNDLSVFGIDLSAWNDIKIEMKKKKVNIFVNSHSIYSLSFNQSLGKITGIHYRFDGLGAVDMLELYDEDQTLSYEENFSDKMK